MNNTSKETQAVQNGGNVSTTATNQHTLAITEYDRDRFDRAICKAMYSQCSAFFKSQPTVLAIIGANIQIAKTQEMKTALNEFVDSVRAINSLLFDLILKRGDYGDLIDFLYTIPLKSEDGEDSEQ